MRSSCIAVTWSILLAAPVVIVGCTRSDAPETATQAADAADVAVETVAAKPAEPPAEPAEAAEPTEPPADEAPRIVPVEPPAQSRPATTPVDLANLPGAAFTAEITTTETGLQFVELVEGEGDAPPASDVAVQVHYTGWLPDGTKFDSSHDRGEPADFVLAGVIPGWTEGVGSMRVGGKRKLVIPGSLAYGPRGNPQAGIGPDQTLVFDVELMAIDPWVDVPDPPPGEPIAGEPIVTQSGATYWVLEEGDGDTAFDDSIYAIHFKLYRSDGKLLFDTTTGDQPLDIVNDTMFPGWREAMASMRAGERRKLLIPWEIGFGPRGNPRMQVPPRASAIFDVDLIAIDRWSDAPEELPGEPVEGEPVVTESGLQYYDIVVGEGALPSGPTATVEVHYTGWLNDGSQFDSSYDKNVPAEFQLGGVIQGWTEGVGSMRVGGTRKLIIPWEMAYGPRGRSGVPPKATLVFDVELLAITNE